MDPWDRLASGLALSDPQLRHYANLARRLGDGYEELQALRPPRPQVVPATREVGERPGSDDDPFHAIVRRCRVTAERSGPLEGMRIAVKDSIAVAGVPMTAGSAVLALTPSADSTVVDRLLRAGAQIVATANMDAFGCSGGGDTSAHGTILNPHDTGRTAGGSSGGSAAALSYPDIDAALGCDQAGSIRLPAAWCGVLGLKPTFGLVPYTRIMGLDRELDHVGPLARTVDDLARVLTVIAGPDVEDPRTRGVAAPAGYLAACATPDVAGLRVGVLTEAVHAVQPPIAAAFAESVSDLGRLGLVPVEISISEHRWGGAIAAGLYSEATANLFDYPGSACVPAWLELAEALDAGLRGNPAGLSPPVILSILMGRQTRERDRGATYGLASLLRAPLSRAYDDALGHVDVLAMPTAPVAPHRIDPELPADERLLRGWRIFANTSQFNMTGHPALSMPAAAADGLPVGVMLVARHGDDALLLRIAAAFERRFGWRPATKPAH
jgi:amidase